MIFTGFVYIGAYILAIISAIFPNSSGFSVEVQSAFSVMAGYVQLLNTLLPIETLAQVLVILVATDVIIFSFKSFKWVFSHIPFVGGRG